MWGKPRLGLALVAALFTVFSDHAGVLAQGQSRYGLFIGPLNSYQHGVSGDVYVVDSRTIHLRNFNYDGSGPAGYFTVGRSSVVGADGIRIPDETGRQGPLRTYRNEHVTLTLPEGMTLSDVSWLSIWCDEFSVNFGDAKFPSNLDYPKPKKIDPLPNLEHSVKSDRIVVVDAQTFLIPQFNYDGQAPDAFFWVGKGRQPSSTGTRVPDENGSIAPLGAYRDKTIVLTLPGDLTVYDIDYLSVWCDEYSVNFGHVLIPDGLRVPPSLRMLGVAPQKHGSSYDSPRPSGSNSHKPPSNPRFPQYPSSSFYSPKRVEYSPSPSSYPTPHPFYAAEKRPSLYSDKQRPSYAYTTTTTSTSSRPSYFDTRPSSQYTTPRPYRPSVQDYTTRKPFSYNRPTTTTTTTTSSYRSPSSSPSRIGLFESRPSTSTAQRYHTILAVPIHHSVERQPQYDYVQPRYREDDEEPSAEVGLDTGSYQQPAAQSQEQLYPGYQQQQEQEQEDVVYVREQEHLPSSISSQPVYDDRERHRAEKADYYNDDSSKRHLARQPRQQGLPVEYKGRKANTYTVDIGAAKSTFTLYT